LPPAKPGRKYVAGDPRAHNDLLNHPWAQPTSFRGGE
jgi:hypothetical protein